MGGRLRLRLREYDSQKPDPVLPVRQGSPSGWVNLLIRPNRFHLGHSLRPGQIRGCGWGGLGAVHFLKKLPDAFELIYAGNRRLTQTCVWAAKMSRC